VHELAVTESILKSSLEYATKENAIAVTDIYLKIGTLSSIVDDSVNFYWQFISKDTICANAELHFERIPAKFLCLECKNEYTIENELSACPNCGSIQVKLISGDEFQLTSIDIER
jgi:hydrogenase nickel incorporation protein HypA/HybF